MLVHGLRRSMRDLSSFAPQYPRQYNYIANITIRPLKNQGVTGGLAG